MRLIWNILTWIIRMVLFTTLLILEYALLLCTELVRTLKGAIRFK